MKCELRSLSGLKRKLDIQLSAEQVQNSFNENYIKKQKKTELPGFRKGKVPMNQIRSMYGEEVKRDTVISLINEFYPKALRQENLNPAGDPKIDIKSRIEEDKAFDFSAVVEIQPDFNIDKDFKVKISKLLLQVETKEVDQALENIRLASAKFEVIQENRGLNWKDFAELEINELSDSVGIGKKSLLEMKKESTLEIEGFKEGIIGMTVGEKKKIPVTLSKNYPIKEHAGKSIDLEVTLLAIKTQIVPEMDDEFIKKFKCKDIDHLKSLIRHSLENEKKNKAYEAMREEALKQLVKENPVDLLPEGVLEEQKKVVISSVEARLQESGISEKDIEQYKKKYQTDFEEKARFIVHSSYLIYALARKLNIIVSPQEIQLHLKNNQSQDIDYNKMEDFLIREKTLKHLIDTAVTI